MYEHTEILYVAQVAVMLQLSSASIYILIDNGDIPAVKRGRRWIIRRSDVLDYIEKYFRK